MAVVKGEIIKKVTANSIIGAVSDFNNRVPEAVYNYATYSSSNLPHFTGSCNWGNNSSTGETYLTNPQAIEDNQFVAKNVPSLTLNDTVITASTLWSAMNNITIALNKVRYFTAKWYHKTNTTSILLDSISGYGTINTEFPNASTGIDAINGKSQYWTREGQNITFSSSSSLQKGKVVLASDINNTIQNCYNSWYNNCYNKNGITYNMYSCHLNCHNNCHSSRSRR